MLKLASAGSGSKGNATLIASDATMVLVDQWLSGKRAYVEAQPLGITIDEIDAILVTHEHADHIAGVAAVASRGASTGLCKRSWHPTIRSSGEQLNFVEIASDSVFTVGDIHERGHGAT